MEKLRKWIRRNGSVKKFLNGIEMSRSSFSDWETGKRGISLRIAGRIVDHTQGFISLEDLLNFEKNIENINMSSKFNVQKKSSDGSATSSLLLKRNLKQ